MSAKLVNKCCFLFRLMDYWIVTLLDCWIIEGINPFQ